MYIIIIIIAKIIIFYFILFFRNVNFISPDYMHNIIVVQRELVHLTPYRQILKNDNCR
jgi:hypothetical protein